MVKLLLPSKIQVYDNKGFPGSAIVKNSLASAGDTRNVGSIPGLGRSPGGEMATYFSILAWKIPRTEEPDGLHTHSMGSESDTTEHSKHERHDTYDNN